MRNEPLFSRTKRVDDAEDDAPAQYPDTPSNSPALFDPVTNPEGWEEIGDFPPQKDALAPDRPWFFNASGTEGQTMRRVSTGGTIRLKISVNGGSATMLNLGNTKVTSSVRRETHYANCEWFSGNNNLPVTTESVRSSSQGSSVVAVDYKRDIEVLAKVEVSSSNTFDLDGRVLSGDYDAAQDSTRLANESRVLRFGGTNVTLRRHVARSRAIYWPRQVRKNLQKGQFQQSTNQQASCSSTCAKLWWSHELGRCRPGLQPRIRTLASPPAASPPRAVIALGTRWPMTGTKLYMTIHRHNLVPVSGDFHLTSLSR